MSRIVILNGGSGSGKTYLSTILQKTSNLPFKVVRAVTDCSRQPRENEIDGKDYYFRTKDEFEKRIQNGEYVEHSLYNGTYRGLRKAELEKCLSQENTIVLLIMDINGVNAIKNIFPNETTSVYLSVPKKTLEERMRERGDSEENIKSRLEYYESSNESDNGAKCDKILKNDETIETLVSNFVEYVNSIM